MKDFEGLKGILEGILRFRLREQSRVVTRLGCKPKDTMCFSSCQGQEAELCCDGGEVGFVLRLVEESAKETSVFQAF